MVRKVIGFSLLAAALTLLVVFYLNRPPIGVERKGGIVLLGLNLNDLVSLLGGIVSLVSGIVTLRGKRKDQ
jgi:hypothetical protein